MDDGQNPTFSCHQLVMKYRHGGLKLAYKIIGSVIVIATLYTYDSQLSLQGMTNNVGLTFSVRDTTLCFEISFERDTKYLL